MQSNQILNPTSNVPEGICRQFSIVEILSATNDFDDSLVLGKGGFSEVYKGEIDNGTRTVAIKKSKSMSPELRKEFRDEILMVSKFRHSHLVSLIGYCETDNEMILVYEYMDGGTLDDNLHRHLSSSKGHLCWIERLKISICVARGLDYLHTGTGINNKVIHRDIKSSNILLDKNRAVAKISDFGFSKIGPANQADTHVLTRVIGTFGYLDPDYYQTCVLSSKSDVYAFGVVLFELLCGRRAVDMTLDQDKHNLAGWARLCIKKGKVDQIVDTNLKSEMTPRSLSVFVKIANRCLNERPKERPTMTEVLVKLVHALSLQEIGKQNGNKMAGKLLEFFSVKPRPISGNYASYHDTKAAENDKDAALYNKEVLPNNKDAAQDDKEAATNNIEVATDDKDAVSDDKKAAPPFNKEAAPLDDKEVSSEDKDAARNSIKDSTDGKDAVSDDKEAASDSKEAAMDDKQVAPNDTAAAPGNEEAAPTDDEEATPPDDEEAAPDDKEAIPNDYEAALKIVVVEPEDKQKKNIEPVDSIHPDELNEITNNFGTESLIFKGTNARLYHGLLKSGRASCIKMLDSNKLPENEFMAKVTKKSMLKHENVVDLIGYCADGDLRALAYEYAPNGSLHDILHGQKGAEYARPGPVLSWLERVKIASGAAKGLEYLLKNADSSFVNYGITSSNVLLFEDCDVAKIAATDLWDEAPNASLHFCSVYEFITHSGYCAPEIRANYDVRDFGIPLEELVHIPRFSRLFEVSGKINTKSIIFSFGVVLLELLTGRKPTDPRLPCGQQHLVTWATPKLSEDKVKLCIDPRLKEEYPLKSAATMACIAARCLRHEPERRMDIGIVVKVLETLNVV